jgi:hypothetical protein
MVKATIGELLLSKGFARGGATAAIPFFQKKDRRALLGLAMTVVCFVVLVSGCSPTPSTIRGIPKDHPAQKFYEAAQQGMLADKVCRDNKGDPTIPIGKIMDGAGYTKSQELMAGVFFFRDDANGKIFLGVSFLQYNGFLQIPKVCAWEEKE